MQTDTPQPREREMERPTWLLQQIATRYGASMHTLYSPGNLKLLADWIAELERQARDDADALVVAHMLGHDQATEQARAIAEALTRERDEARDLVTTQVAERQDDLRAMEMLAQQRDGARAEVERLRRDGGAPEPRAASACSCRECCDAREQDVPTLERTTTKRMIVCRRCGYKRCPHADSHRYACIHSKQGGTVSTALAPAQEGARA